jgi:anaerobic magnesium-protoporphyrin IX monomethyl ester cyclase
MKILLVVPPNSLAERYGKLKFVGTVYPSLGLAAIGAVAEANGHEVKLVDCEAIGLSYDDLEKEIRAYQPELIGLQTFCNTIQRTLEIAKRVKEKIDPNIKIVFGGVQATFFPEEYVADKNVDFVVVGEGEIIFKNLLDALKNNATDFSNINGLVWKKDGQAITNPPEKLIENLDILPFPARHLFDWKLYHPSAQ